MEGSEQAGSEQAGSGDSELIRRLLDTTPDVAPPMPPRPIEVPPAPPEPEGATFRVREADWDETGGRAALSQASATAALVRRRSRELAGPSARRAAQLAIFALAILGAFAGLAVAAFHLINDPLSGARALYDAADRLNHGHALYPGLAAATAGGADPATLAYPYPPLLAIVLRPAALLPFWLFAIAWEVVVVLSLAGLAWRLGLRSQRTWLAIGILGIPIGWALTLAQAQLPAALLLAIGQPWSLALATNLTLFPLLAALWWVGRRDWEATIAFVLYTVLLGLVSFLLDSTGTLAYLQHVAPAEIGAVRELSPIALSPELFAVLLAIAAGVVLMLARTRWGWPAAVLLSSLAPPRLLAFALTSLLAAVREPVQANLPQPEPRPWSLVAGGGRH